MAARARALPGVDVYEDRRLELTASMAIDVRSEIDAVRDALASAARDRPM